MMAPPPPSLDPRAMGEEEKVKRKMEETRRKEGDINDGIVEFQVSLSSRASCSEAGDQRREGQGLTR